MLWQLQVSGDGYFGKYCLVSYDLPTCRAHYLPRVCICIDGTARINLPICAISLVGIAIFLRLHQQKRSIQEKLREFDYIGMGLFMASLTAFVIPITWGGTEFAWNSWRTLFPLCLGAAGLVICFVYEGRISKTPFIPSQLFYQVPSDLCQKAAKTLTLKPQWKSSRATRCAFST